MKIKLEIEIIINVTRMHVDGPDAPFETHALNWKNEYAVELHCGRQIINMGNFDSRAEALELVKRIEFKKPKS